MGHLNIVFLRGVSPVLVLLLLGLSSGCSRTQERTDTPKSVPVGKGPDALFLTPNQAFLYVANVEDTTISVIDTRSDQVIRTIAPVHGPWGFARLGEPGLVAVSAWGKEVCLLDFSRHEIVRRRQFDVNLGGIVASADGQRLFVTAPEAGEVLQLASQTLTIEKRLPVGKGPDGIGLAKNDSILYVANTQDGTISVLFLATGKTELLSVGGKPELIHSNVERSLLAVSNFEGNKLYILEAGAARVVQELTELSGPEGAYFSTDGARLYAVNFNSSKIFVYDCTTWQKLPAEYQVGIKPIDILVTTAGGRKKMYVSMYGENAIGVFPLQETE